VEGLTLGVEGLTLRVEGASKAFFVSK
jgi:hypothetical protein